LKRKYVIILFFLIIAYLSLHRLDNTYFWGDEAHVGIIARNFLSTGQLTGWDGRNLYAYWNGGALDKNLRTVDAPLDIWVCAASFKLFGQSTWSGRIPFVIIGLIGLGIFILIIKHDFGDDTWLCFYTLAAFGLSPAFLLNIRQCRYYALSLTFAILSYYAYRLCLSTKRIYYFLILSVASILAFYANPMICAAFVLALGIIHLLFHRRDFSTRDWKMMFLAIFLFLIATVPYAVHFRIWNRPDHYLSTPEPWFTRHFILTWWNLRDLNQITYMPWPVLIGLIYLFIQYRQKETILKTALEWGVLALLNTFFIAWISPQPTTGIQFSVFADVRYLIASLPFCLGLVGIFLWYVNRWSRWIGVTLLIVILSSNVLTLTPNNQQPRWLLPNYIYEIHHDYPTSCSAVVNYLATHAQQDDSVWCLTNGNAYPIMFYLGDKLKFCCILNYQTHLPLDVIRKLNAPLLVDENFPDWIIIYGTQPKIPVLLKFFSRVHKENGVNVEYSYDLIDALDIYWEDRSRPELNMHSFGPQQKYDMRYEAVYIFKKKKVTG
jgi:hypothetical protein